MCSSSRQKHMLKVVESLQAAYDVFAANDSILGEAACATLQRHLTRLCQNFQVLDAMAYREGKSFWKAVPKLHYAGAHLAWQAQLVNPRHVQGYVSESMVGQLCAIYELSQSGPFRRTVQRVAMQTYRLGLQLLWD